MPVLVKKVEGQVETNLKASVKIMGISSAMDLEDYINIPSLIGLLQNFSKVMSATELFIDGVDVYRMPDDGNHPTLTRYGLKTNTEYSELLIDYA